ncbi:hypothetical protein BGZ80_011692 [Entomortierella chlamydospora]|uniref:Uncharacterized protein n=1 Tax=Entomortierella chlamydospora TaxID=101097 RepID=A0A9P6SYT8_9FUNG|nr:hypothetical protein BGZ80_011692 [Entomortierella chlamydospora]
MAVTQDAPAPSASAARRAATAATVAANKAKAASANKTQTSSTVATKTAASTNSPTSKTAATATAKPAPKPSTSSTKTAVSKTTPKAPTTTTTIKTATSGPSATVRKSATPSPATKPTTGTRPSTATKSPSTPKTPVAPKTPSNATKKPTTSSSATGTASSSASPAAASRRVPATATARTTTSIRVPPATTGSAAKPPAVGGRPPVSMTATTIRLPPKTPATKTPVKKDAASAPGTPISKPVSKTGTAASSHNRASSMATTTVKKMSTAGTASPAGSVRSVRTTASVPASPMELKKAIASVKAKFEDVSTRLKVKENELVSLCTQLDVALSFDNLAATETASSDGGETLVPEIDLSKLASKDKDVVMAVISAKEKDITRKKNQVKTMKARVEQLRMSNERTLKELKQKDAELQEAQDQELASLHVELAESIQKHNDVVLLRQKLEESRALHSATIEKLNRIHDNKLQCLEVELQSIKRGRLERSGEGYFNDLEPIREAHRKELTHLLGEYRKEIEEFKAQSDAQEKQEVDEFQTELKERLDSELKQIRASHASLINERSSAESNMANVLQERHVRNLEDMKIKTEKDHKTYLGTVHSKHQSEIERLKSKHDARIAELESKIETLQEKYKADLADIRSKADATSNELVSKHSSEIAACKEKHAADLINIESSTKEKMQLEFDAVQAKFSSFVGNIQGTQDSAMRDLEAGYETRIAELIVGHEDRVRELENEANEQVEQELERVEMEFERDQERIIEEHAQKLEELRASHQVIITKLEDQLTIAEGRAKETIEATRQRKRAHEEEMNEVKAELEAQLSAVHTSTEALINSNERDGKSRAEALQAGHAAIIGTEKSAFELKLSEALTKKETAWNNRNELQIREIKSIRSRLSDAKAECDKARSAVSAIETRMKEEYTTSVNRLLKEQRSRLDHSQDESRTRLAKVTRTHDEHAEMHENKLADLQTSHHKQLQALRDQQEAVLKSREQENQRRIVALQQSLAAKMASSGYGSTTSLRAAQELSELKKKAETLQGENEQLERVVKHLQQMMPTIA